MKHIILLMLLIVSVSTYSQKTTWINSIKNPENAEFVNEVAFNKGIKFIEVTQSQFDERYLTPDVIYESKFDSLTNITYVDNSGVRSQVYVTKNNKIYISKISKKNRELLS